MLQALKAILFLVNIWQRMLLLSDLFSKDIVCASWSFMYMRFITVVSELLKCIEYTGRCCLLVTDDQLF